MIRLPDMCRNIRPLNNLAPPVTEQEIADAALQYVRKIAGTRAPSRANQEVFAQAVDEVAEVTRRLLASLTTTAPPRDRAVLAAQARERAAGRYARPTASA